MGKTATTEDGRRVGSVLKEEAAFSWTKVQAPLTGEVEDGTLTVVSPGQVGVCGVGEDSNLQKVRLVRPEVTRLQGTWNAYHSPVRSSGPAF